MLRPALGALAAIFLTMALSGCGGGDGGGGGGPRPVAPPILSLPSGHGLGAGEITVAAGVTEEHGNVVVTCPPGGAACVVSVMADGTALYDRAGGVPSVEPKFASWGVPPGHGLMTGEITVAAGDTEERGNVVVTCPPGGNACVVSVMADGTVGYARTGGVPAFTFVRRTYETDNPSAEDLLDHWNDPERLRAALGLSPVPPAEAADRTSDLSDLIDAAGGNPAETGTRLRNVRPEDIEIVGERDGITYGRWTGGPAGTLNIEFDWRFAPEFDEATRTRMERAGKSWSWRLRDDFGTNVVEPGTQVPYGEGAEGVILDERVLVDGVLIIMIDGGDSRTSSAGPRTRTNKDNDHEPWLGLLRLSQRHVESTAIMAHEVGHAIGVSDWDTPSLTRYINRAESTFEGPEAVRANGGQPVPFQWVDGDGRPVAPNTPGAEVDWGHLGVCASIMAYCSDPEEVYVPSELDFAYLADIGYELLPAAAAAEPELYGYGAWGTYSAWGAGVERTLHYQGGQMIEAADTLRASADAFGTAPGLSLAEAHGSLQGGVTWSGSLIGVDLGQAMLPPVFGDAELQVELSTLRGTALFDGLTVHVGGESSPFRSSSLGYDIGVAGNAFSDGDGRVLGGFHGPAHEEMAGVLNDRRADVNLVAGFGGTR